MGEYDKNKLELYLNVNAAIKSKKFIVLTKRVDNKELKISSKVNEIIFPEYHY